MGLLEGPVKLYNPQNAGAYAAPEATLQVRDRPGLIENPWLLWIRDALEGRSIDIAHFICHGYLSRDQGALAFSETPLRNEDRRMARFVGAAELIAFLTQTGAWSAAFSSPEHNYSQMGLRQLADTIAQMRPGPVIHHEIPLDVGGEALAGIYRFLFGPAPQNPPASPALFAYCHPSRVTRKPQARELAGYTFRASEEPMDAVPSHPLLKPIFEAEDNVPSWIAASQRFIEQQNLEILKLTREPGSERGKTATELRETLREIQDVIAKSSRHHSMGRQIMSNRTIVAIEPSFDEAASIKLIKAPANFDNALVPQPFSCDTEQMPPWTQPDAVKAYGQKIFTLLKTHPAIRSALDYALLASHGQVHAIYFKVDVNDAERLCWETLCNEHGQYLALDRRWPIARMADSVVDQPAIEYVFRPPLRILALHCRIGDRWSARMGVPCEKRSTRDGKMACRSN